ncbi:MAG: hypothetical protein K2L12_06610 [Clostridia bacterium]|nr:hypothetical protein [Clostridia bacterium]
MGKKDYGEKYIEQIPRLKKWINECICCHKKGYKPNLPEKISSVDGSLDVYFIKKYFKPLSINQDGLCDVCAKFFNK